MVHGVAQKICTRLEELWAHHNQHRRASSCLVAEALPQGSCCLRAAALQCATCILLSRFCLSCLSLVVLVPVTRHVPTSAPQACPPPRPALGLYEAPHDIFPGNALPVSPARPGAQAAFY